MCLEVLSSSSPSFLLEKLLIPESTGLLLDDSFDDVTVTEGGACIQAGPGADDRCPQKQVVFLSTLEFLTCFN